jgi:hypothetical protein
MTLEKSIKKYEEITKETFQQSPDLSLKVVGSDFMLWKLFIRDGIPYFWIDQTFGQMNNFVDFIREVCNSANIEWIVTATTRNPKSHMRKWKMERLTEYDYTFEGRFYYALKGHLSNLK